LIRPSITISAAFSTSVYVLLYRCLLLYQFGW